MILQPKESINDHSSKNTTIFFKIITINWIGPQNKKKQFHNKREPDKAVKIISTIVLTKTQLKHVISLQQSTESGPRPIQTISRPKGTHKSRQIHFYNRIDKNTTKTRLFITSINQNRLKTNQTISQPKVPVKVMIFLSQSSCWRSIFIKHEQNA